MEENLGLKVEQLDVRTDVLLKDLYQVRNEIVLRVKEKEGVEAERDKALKELSDARTAILKVGELRGLLTGNLDKDIEDMESVKAKLEMDISALLQNKANLESEITKTDEGLLKRKKEVKRFEDSQSEEINRLSKLITNLKDSIPSYKEEADQEKEKIEVIKKRLADVEQLDNKRSILLEEIKSLEGNKFKLEQMAKDAAKFLEETETTLKEVKRIYHEVRVIHSRLSPSYIKEYKEFSNIT